MANRTQRKTAKFLDKNPFQNQTMVDYWIDIIRNKRDAFRTYVSDPALFERLVTLKPHSKVLDLGCGEGYLSRKLASNGHEVVGIDSSSYFITVAKAARLADEQYLVQDALSLDFPDEYFDAVVSNFVFMDLACPERAIKESGRVLKSGGRLIFQILHPFTFTSNSGEIRNSPVINYFKTQEFSEKFLVAGKESPVEGIRFHHPLSRYTRALHDSGLAIIFMDEPTPITSTPLNNPIRQIFKKPWFLLIDAVKKR